MIIAPTINPVGAFGGHNGPFTNITPFTYRSGEALIEYVERLRVFVTSTISPYVDDAVQTLVTTFIKEVTRVVDDTNASLISQAVSVNEFVSQFGFDLTAQLAAQDTDVNTRNTATRAYVDAAVQSIINSTIAVTDPVITALDADSATTFRVQSDARNKKNYLDINELNLQSSAVQGSTVDNTAKLAALFTSAATVIDANGQRAHDGSLIPVTRVVKIPAGVWNTTTAVTIPANVSVLMDPNAVIRATAAITGPLIKTVSGASWRGQFFSGGTIDCNQLADDGILINLGSKSRIENVNIQDAKRYGVFIGTTSEIGSSFEIALTDVHPSRRDGLTVPTGSVGVYINRASDCSFNKVNPVGQETSFLINGGNHKFSQCHAWGYPGAFPSICFDDRGGAFNTYFQCVADSPAVAGWHLEIGYSLLNGCTVLIHPSQPDSTVIGVRLGASATYARAIGCRFQGQSEIIRLLADFKGVSNETWMNTATIVAQETFNSVAKVARRNMFSPYSVAGQLAERSIYIPGTVVVGDLPVSVFWMTPVQVDSVVIRAGSGSGTQFQVWQGGTQLTPTFGLGDNATLLSPFNTGAPVKLAAFAGMYIKVVTAGTGSNFTTVFKAYLNG